MQAERISTALGQSVHGPLLLSPRLFEDARGFFFESWNQRGFAALLEEDGQASVGPFVQDNHSLSCRGVLRGLHYQLDPHAQGKLVRCVAGEIFDVVVDLRQSSPSFGLWVGTRLDAVHHQQLWVPAGFAHGFLTLSEQAEVLYKSTEYWIPSSERDLRWNDPELAITWPLDELERAQLQLSPKDVQASLWAQAVVDEVLFA